MSIALTDKSALENGACQRKYGNKIIPCFTAALILEPDVFVQSCSLLSEFSWNVRNRTFHENSIQLVVPTSRATTRIRQVKSVRQPQLHAMMNRTINDEGYFALSAFTDVLTRHDPHSCDRFKVGLIQQSRTFFYIKCGWKCIFKMKFSLLQESGSTATGVPAF